MLEGKNVMVFAATGAIGGEAARTLAREGARVWLSGRDEVALQTLVEEISGDGGEASAEVVDATDPGQVSAYVDRVAGTAGRVDAAFNAIGMTPAQLGYPARSAELDFEVFLRPLRVILGSTFLTSRAVADRMVEQGGGSIVTLSATLGGLTIPYMAALSATCGGIEAMTRSLSAEFGPAGVRVNCVRGDAMPETSTIRETQAGTARILGIDPSEMQLPPGPLGRPIRISETAATVAFFASDASSGMTSQVVNVSGQALAG